MGVICQCFFVGCCIIFFLQVCQQCIEIQLLVGNIDVQCCQCINEVVECFIVLFFVVLQYFFFVIYLFFDLFFSSQLLCFGQIKNIWVIWEVNGIGKWFIFFWCQCEVVINLFFCGICIDFGKVNFVFVLFMRYVGYWFIVDGCFFNGDYLEQFMFF